MTKYILSSGSSVISDMTTVKGTLVGYTTTNVAEQAVQFETIGEAMKTASEVNKILGQALYRVVPIDIN